MEKENTRTQHCLHCLVLLCYYVMPTNANSMLHQKTEKNKITCSLYTGLGIIIFHVTLINNWR